MGNLVTLDQLRNLVKADKIRPEEIFDAETLEEVRKQARAEGYAEARVKAMFEEKPLTAEDVKPKAEGEDKSEVPAELDPSRNPLIKIA
jgi:hypothetical protein